MNSNSTMPDLLAQAVRYALIALGGYLAKKGVDGELITLISGFATAGAALAWGFYVKYGTKAVPTAVTQRIDVPTVSPITGKTQS